jgi:hypothetical protein
MAEEIFKFAMALETFHCVEGLQKGIVDYDTIKWYSEGLAEYFANLVYRDINYEHRSLPAFHHNSMKHSLLDMSYDAALFFQYLENRFGPAYLANLYTALPGQGDRSA